MKEVTQVEITTVNSLIEKYKNEIDESSKHFIQTEVKVKAANLGRLNIPEHDAPSLEPFIGEIRAFYKRKLSDISLAFSGTVQEQLSAMQIHTKKQLLKDTENTRSKLEQEIAQFKIDRERIRVTRDPKNYKAAKALLLAVAIAEVIGYTLSYIKLNDSILLAMVLGLLTGISQTYLVKVIAISWRDKGWSNWSAFKKALLGSGIALGIVALSCIRYWYVQSSDSTASLPYLSILVFIAITTMLVGFVGGYTYLYYPSEEELQKLNRLEEIDNAILDREKRIKEYEASYNAITKEINVYGQVYHLMTHGQEEFRKRIQSHFEEAIGEWRHENRIRRSDGMTPYCFGQPIAPLTDETDGLKYSDTPKSEAA